MRAGTKSISILRGAVTDLRRRRFGQLKVMHFAGIFHQHAYWCCQCRCLETCADCHGAGCSTRVRGTLLITGKQISCGCSRTDPGKHENAALRIPVSVRRERASMGGKCRAKNPPVFRLRLSRAADLLNLAPEKVMDLSRDGILRTRMIGKQIRVSATDVADYIAQRSRAVKVCPAVSASE